MGAVIKYVLIAIIVLYLINKVGKFFYELFFPGKLGEKQAANGRSTTSSRQQNYNEGDVHVSKEPNEKNKNFKGGDYVDFEEVD